MPAVVQTASGNGTTLSFASATTAGNCVVVCFLDNGSLTTPSVSAMTLGGSAGNFAALVTSTNSAGHQLATIWADPSCAGGQTAIAVTEASGNHPVIIAYEISGIASASPLDKSSTGNASSGTWSSGTTATTTQAAEAWVGCAVINNTPPTGPGAPWTNTNQTNSTTQAIAGQQITSSTGTATYNGTSGSTNWAAAVVTLLPSSNPSGQVQPRATVPVPRRVLARVLWRGQPGAGVASVPAPVQRPPVVAPRRQLARAVWRGVTGQAFVSVAAPRLQPAPAPRRVLARAYVRFTPVTTTNPAPISGRTQPRAALPAPRRTLSRAYVRFTPVTTVNAPPVISSVAGASPPGEYERNRIVRKRRRLFGMGL